ncbi:FadR/GntR family transcriptional regulator [Microbacterium sp. 18062]|uniref:FadR/GntR family transcriptional regulator n=1 Tax=Microbacterium sp. 18062 TaxID=2681410 RepID=UPI00135CE240|nr:FadR/GntR family transcriptional regulator [Microbacterium sp. 18062]
MPTNESAATTATATTTVVEHVEHLVFGGDLEPGDTLPSESELAATLGVSRLTVREAFRSLQARGLVEISHGRRPVVAHPNALPLGDFFSASVRRDARGLLELLEVRLAVEVHATQLAATHATSSDLNMLAMVLDLMRRSVEDEQAFNDADVRFHAAVGAASGNRMLGFLIEGMDEPLHHSRLNSIRGYQRKNHSLQSLVDQHEEIYRRIAAHDGRGAATAMRKHLQQTRNDLRTAFAIDAPGRTDPDAGSKAPSRLT